MKGEKIRFSCKTAGMPPPMVVWTKEQRPLAYTSNIYLTDGNDLVIDKVSVYDSGLYTCSAISPLGSSQKNFTLFVYVSPSIFPTDIEPELQVVEGQLVHLPCSVSGTPSPTVVWRRDDLPVSGRKHIDETGMRFVANLTDFGNYTCFTENDYGNASVSYYLYVWVAPSVLPLEASITALIGTNVTLQCDAVGFPIPTVSWEFKQTTLVANNTNISFNEVGNLYISNVSAHDEGSYDCIAANEAGEDRKTVRLNVYEPPKITEPADGSFVATNMDMELVIACKATGRPKPYIAWTKDDYYLDNDANFAVEYDGTLTIKAPSEELSGVYTCVAKNIAGEANKTVPVEIYSVPTLPQSEESHTKVVVVEGTNATVECPLRASRNDVVKWYKDAKLVSSGTLQITNVSRHNTSEYVCVINNVAGSAIAKVLVEVQWPPSLEKHINNTIDVEVIKGNDWYFNCAADALPRAKTKWFFNNQPMVFEDRDRLRILNVDKKHAGLYRCLVTNPHGTVSNTYNLKVLVPPYISEFDFLEVQLKENSDATLECNAKGYPIPDIKWTFNNSNWKTEGSTLISHNISNDFGGIFRCTASNNAGTSVLTYKVTVVSAAKVNEIVVYTQGVGETVLTRADVKQGTRVRISCKALGQPVPKIQWIKSGNVLSENKSNISYADFVLEDIRTIHSGIYSCVVLNEGGMDEKKFRLEVLEPPKIFNTLFETVNPSNDVVNLEVLSGQSFSMHCHPYGNPIPEVYWFKDGLPLRLFDDSMVSTDFGEVIVANKARYEQSGNYTCVARNSVGNASFVYLVDVLVPPPIPKDSVRVTTTRIGHVLNLTCPVEGSPAPVVTWLRQPYEEIGQNTPRVELLNDNVTLLINNTAVSDSGKYSCVMTNKVGTTEIVFDVTIEMAPSIAGNVGKDIAENHVVPLMRSVVLKCEVKGHPAPSITWLKDTQRIPNDSSNIQYVLGSSLLGVWRVTSEAAGQYVCVAQNNAGAAHRRYNVAVQVPGKWSTWSSWSFCNTTCGPGYQHRSRICQYIDDDNVTYDKTTQSQKVILDMSECKGSEVDKRRCNMPPCEEPVVARWSTWSPWSSCSASCGSGTQARTRKCMTTRPCYGTNVQIRKCPKLPKCEGNAEKRDIEASSIEETTDTDPYMPAEVYEMQPEVISMHRNKILDVEEFGTKPAIPSAVFYDVNVNNNLDFSDPGPCNPGFTHNGITNTCDDIDECGIEYNQCHVSQMCANTLGGYRCGCAHGYASLGAGQRCLDVNECEQEVDGCEFACVNVAGGYVCACPRHLRLHIDKHHCVSPSEYRLPMFEDLDTGDYLSATIDLSTNNRKGRG
ncbi:unnamed protein product [Chilo suppressalis]|uniref:Hemicentin-1 n=1 Tax=Chilo suppressalis TaxID=168631 RepID=A0ABN8E9G4_CHISP|nr:unnamed protein product [Chilo suppressalis]